MDLLQKYPNLIVVIGINDSKSSEVKKVVADTNIRHLYLNYDLNKSLMIDLNIRRVPVVLFFKNMDIVKEIYPPMTAETIKETYKSIHGGES